MGCALTGLRETQRHGVRRNTFGGGHPMGQHAQQAGGPALPGFFARE